MLALSRKPGLTAAAGELAMLGRVARDDIQPAGARPHT